MTSTKSAGDRTLEGQRQGSQNLAPTCPFRETDCHRSAPAAASAEWRAGDCDPEAAGFADGDGDPDGAGFAGAGADPEVANFAASPADADCDSVDAPERERRAASTEGPSGSFSMSLNNTDG